MFVSGPVAAGTHGADPTAYWAFGQRVLAFIMMQRVRPQRSHRMNVRGGLPAVPHFDLQQIGVFGEPGSATTCMRGIDSLHEI